MKPQLSPALLQQLTDALTTPSAAVAAHAYAVARWTCRARQQLLNSRLELLLKVLG